jgi:hypothetical protein
MSDINIEGIRRPGSSIRVICAALGKYGPMTVEQLRDFVRFSDDTIRKACSGGKKAGFLSATSEEGTTGSGRSKYVYARTKKPLPKLQITAKSQKRRERVEKLRAAEAERVRVAEPFRHWQDVALFGNCVRAG